MLFRSTGLSYDDWFNQCVLDLFTLASADADSMLSNINSLRESLPAVTADTHLPHEDHEYRIRRRSPFTIIGGVIGTLMGWFIQRRLNNLRDRIEEVEDQQHRLLHVQAVQLNVSKKSRPPSNNCTALSRMDTQLGLVIVRSILLVTNSGQIYKN